MKIPASGNLISVEEMAGLQRLVVLVLRFIQEQMDEPRTELSQVISLSFRKDKGSAYYVTDPRIFVGTERTVISYLYPEGCDMREVFGCLYYQVLALGLAITNGKLHTHMTASEAVQRSFDNYTGSESFTLTFTRRR